MLLRSAVWKKADQFMEGVVDGGRDRSGVVDPEEVRAQLARILADRSFAAAPQLSRLLKQLVEAALSGDLREVKEYALGAELFGRGTSFDPKIDNIVRAHAHRLRGRLEEYFDGPGRADPVVIEIPKGHYIARFHWQSQDRLSAAPPFAAPEPAVRSSRTTWSRVAIYAGAIAILGVAIVVALVNGYPPGVLPGESSGRIEIRPFDLTTDDEESVRLASDLMNSLERYLATGGVETVVYEIDADAKQTTPAGEFTLRGTVERDEGNFVVTARLLHRSQAQTLWSVTQKRPLHESRLLQEQLSIQVASVLRCALRDRRHAQGDASPELFSKFLRYCEVALDDRYAELPELARRIREAAPRYAVSHAMCAGANALATIFSYNQFSAADQERMRKLVYECAEAALAIDPNIGSAYFSMAIVHDPARGLAERERLFQKSLEVEPEFLYSRSFYAALLGHVGRKREAHAYFERIANDEPLTYASQFQRARAAVAIGDIATARTMYARAAELIPDSDFPVKSEWAMQEHWLGDPKRARELMEDQRARMIERGTWECFQTFLGARTSDVALTEAEIETACASGFHVPAEQILAYFGHVDAAFRAIESRFENYNSRRPNSGPVRWLFSPQMRSVRADVRFMSLAARIGLVEYWIESDQWPDFCADEKLSYECKETARSTLRALEQREERGAPASN